MYYAKIKMESEYYLHIRTAAGEPAAHLSLRPDHGVAPMGYGKTTAVNWYLEQRAKAEALNVIRISVYSDNLEIFWKSVQNAFARAGFDFLRDYTFPTDAAGNQPPA